MYKNNDLQLSRQLKRDRETTERLKTRLDIINNQDKHKKKRKKKLTNNNELLIKE